MQFYNSEQKFLTAVDCIIFGFDSDGLKLLLLKRNFNPSMGEWSLMGGFLKKGESLDQAAERVLFSLTGLNNLFMEQLGAFGEVDRDPGERVISVAYFALINIEEYDHDTVKKHNAFWLNINELPDLIFDHSDMVQKAHGRLKTRAATKPVGFNLLPDKFTLPQLQKLYEDIYQKPLDKRNFRKKILAMDILEKMEEKDKESSKRGAFFYRFKEEKYNNLLKEGFSFGI